MTTKKTFEEQVLENLYGLKTDVHGLKTDVHGLKKDVHGLKKDVHGLKKDVHGLKTDVHGLKKDVHGLKKDVYRVEVLQEEIRDDIVRIVEGVSSIHEEVANKADQQTVDDMAHGIRTIQKAVKATNQDLLSKRR